MIFFSYERVMEDKISHPKNEPGNMISHLYPCYNMEKFLSKLDFFEQTHDICMQLSKEYY